jgi:hypothetical protein
VYDLRRAKGDGTENGMTVTNVAMLNGSGT